MKTNEHAVLHESCQYLQYAPFSFIHLMRVKCVFGHVFMIDSTVLALIGTLMR